MKEPQINSETYLALVNKSIQRFHHDLLDFQDLKTDLSNEQALDILQEARIAEKQIHNFKHKLQEILIQTTN